MMKQSSYIYCILFCVFLIYIPTKTFAQSSNKKYLLKQLIDEQNDGEYPTVIDIQENQASIEIKDEEDPWSVSFSIIDNVDLNNDSIKDYIISRNSYGMLGGNVKTNGSIHYLIMKNDSIVDKEYELLLYAPFSYNISDTISYDKNSKVLTIYYTQNFKVYYNEDGLESTIKHFKYINNNLYELSYLDDCQLGNMKNKAIFKENLANVERSLSIDSDNFTEISSEIFKTDNLQIAAFIGGCDNLNLNFQIIEKDLKSNNSVLTKDRMLEILSFLSENTRFKSILNKAIISLSKTYIKSDFKEIDFIDLGNNWSFKLSLLENGSTTNKITYTFDFQQTINKNQIENWEIVTRKK